MIITAGGNIFRSVILGAPASGKGTISSRIVKCFDMVHLSSGDLLRNQFERGSELGLEVQKFVNEGKLVPDNIMANLVLSELQHLETKNWLLDGFPRTRHQAEELLSKYPLQLAIALEIPVDEIIERVKGRWIHVPSGRVYNESYNRPKVTGKDDITGETLTKRQDDAPDAVRRRLELYSQSVEPLLELYRERNILETFEGRTSDEIWPKVKKAISNFLPHRP